MRYPKHYPKHYPKVWLETRATVNTDGGIPADFIDYAYEKLKTKYEVANYERGEWFEIILKEEPESIDRFRVALRKEFSEWEKTKRY